MNKDFEKELKQYAKDQTPDLWSRIEAGIDKEMRIVSREKKRRARNIRFFASLAACVAAILLTIPVYRYVTGNNSGKNADTAQVETEVLEMAAAEEEEALEVEEAAPEVVVTEEAAEEAAPVDTQEEVTLEDVTDTEILAEGKNESAGNSDASDEPKDSANTGEPDAEPASETEPQSGISDNPTDVDDMTALTENGGSAYVNITATLTSIDANGYLLMTVVSDPAGKLASGATVMLDVSMLVENTWTIGGNYVVSFGAGKQTESGMVHEVTGANAVE